MPTPRSRRIALALVLAALGSPPFANAGSQSMNPPVPAPTTTPDRAVETRQVAGSNLVLNGGFELTSATGCEFNLSNATLNTRLAHVTAFGSAEEVDVMKDPAGCVIGPPHGGVVKIGLSSQNAGGLSDALAMELSAPVIAGSSYAVSFFGWAHPDAVLPEYRGAVEVGLSNDPNTFGTSVFFGIPGPDGWQEFSSEFVAPVGATYLTLRQNNNGDIWNHVDDVSLTLSGPVPAVRRSWGSIKAHYR